MAVTKALWISRVFCTAVLLIATLPTSAAEREVLTSAELMSAPDGRVELVANRYFLPMGSAGEAHEAFAGTIAIPDNAMSSEPAEILPAEILGKKTQLFPGVELDFVSHDGFLVPADRDILIPDDSDSYWQIQVSPGRTWSEPGDAGWSRAAFPFLLTSIIENESYNGVATFLYRDGEVSALRYQLVHQLAPFMIQTRFIAAGQAEVGYRDFTDDREQISRSFEAELADRLAWRDWSVLEERYGADLLADFNSGVDPDLTITSGLVIDGEVYVRSMDTPWGPYPFPREMRHGVWSVTKTAAGMLTLMRMAQKYGDEILDYRIRDYLDVTATHDGWEDVTFRNAMSMATGIGMGTLNVDPNVIGLGDSSNPDNAAGFDKYMAWYLAPTLNEKLTEVFRIPSYPWGPGKHARYRDRDIFTLSAALESLLKKKEGPDADLWQMMVDEVYRPIGIHHISMTRTREPQGRGTPILAWGIYVSIDDITKIAMLIQNGGMHDGVQILSKAGIAEALYETDVRGLPTGEHNVHGAKSYHLSLWQEPYVTESGKTVYAPRMRGYGGNIVQLMPNGMIGFRFGSGGRVALEQMTVIADKIRPFDEHPRR
jgi:hypothetical protein